MYEREETTATSNSALGNNKKSAHIKMAEDMAKIIITSYSHVEQNDIIRYIKSTIFEQRKIEIKEMEDRLDYLRISLDEL